MQLFFIRHGQSVNNALWLATGSNDRRSEDPELTDVGREQARLAAQLLKSGNPDGGSPYRGESSNGFGITHLYSSLMVRAVATGSIIASELDLPLRAWEDLHETGGIFLEDSGASRPKGLPGKNRAYFSEHFPALVLPDDLPEAGWWNNRDFEEPPQIKMRARRLLGELLSRHQNKDDRVAVVSHGGFYHNLMSHVLGLPHQDGFWFRINNTGITRIDFHPEIVDFIYLNRLDFLPPELVT